MSDWLDEAIQSSKVDGLPDSRWHQEAAVFRLIAERNGTWETPDVDPAVLEEVAP